MTDQELIQALRGAAVETGSLLCLGCGYEHSCSVHGCVVLRAAAERLKGLTALPPNDPLTLEELRGMDGEPVWVISQDGRNGTCWMLVDTEYELCREAHGGMAVFENNGKTWLAYRREPEEGEA